MFVFFTYLDEGALCTGGGGGGLCPMLLYTPIFFCVLTKQRDISLIQPDAGHLVKKLDCPGKSGTVPAKAGLSRQKRDCPGKSGTFGRSVYLL